jgi:hypothetical protein
MHPASRGRLNSNFIAFEPVPRMNSRRESEAALMFMIVVTI